MIKVVKALALSKSRFQSKQLGIAVLTVAVSIGISSCALERGWTARDKNDFKSGVCESWLGVDGDSSACECILEAARAAYPEADDFWSDDEPSPALLVGWRMCGVGITD